MGMRRRSSQLLMPYQMLRAGKERWENRGRPGMNCTIIHEHNRPCPFLQKLRDIRPAWGCEGVRSEVLGLR